MVRIEPQRRQRYLICWTVLEAGNRLDERYITVVVMRCPHQIAFSPQEELSDERDFFGVGSLDDAVETGEHQLVRLVVVAAHVRFDGRFTVVDAAWAFAVFELRGGVEVAVLDGRLVVGLVGALFTTGDDDEGFGSRAAALKPHDTVLALLAVVLCAHR